MSTDSPFAIVLAFYETYRHVKLVEEDLRKIAEKYAKRPQKILAALGKKYSLPFPQTVSLDCVRRLLALYPVPQCYADLIWAHVAASVSAASGDSSRSSSSAPRPSSSSSQAVQGCTGGSSGGAYDPRLDTCSPQFDASVALQQGCIVAPRTDVPRLENVFKFKVQLVHSGGGGGSEERQGLPAKPDRTLIDKAKAILAQVRGPHSFDSLAARAVKGGSGRKGAQAKQRAFGAPPNSSDNRAAEVTVGGGVGPRSPLALLEQLMRSKARAHVVLRRRGGVKGVLLGYVQAFDRHMNLLLADVDEVSAPNWNQVRAGLPLLSCIFCFCLLFSSRCVCL